MIAHDYSTFLQEKITTEDLNRLSGLSKDGEENAKVLEKPDLHCWEDNGRWVIEKNVLKIRREIKKYLINAWSGYLTLQNVMSPNLPLS
jgi:hypothetical protein